MAFTAKKYDDAIRTVFMDKSKKCSSGESTFRPLAFCFVRIDGSTYIEPLPEFTEKKDASITAVTIPKTFHSIQSADMDNSVSYNGSRPPVFEKHVGV